MAGRSLLHASSARTSAGSTSRRRGRRCARRGNGRAATAWCRPAWCASCAVSRVLNTSSANACTAAVGSTFASSVMCEQPCAPAQPRLHVPAEVLQQVQPDQLGVVGADRVAVARVGDPLRLGVRRKDVGPGVDGDGQHHLVHRVARLAHAGGEREVAVLGVDEHRFEVPQPVVACVRIDSNRARVDVAARGHRRGRKNGPPWECFMWCGPVEKFSTATLPPRGAPTCGAQIGRTDQSSPGRPRSILPIVSRGKTARLEEARLPSPLLRQWPAVRRSAASTRRARARVPCP